MLGQQGGENRIKILEYLRERSCNLNQLANVLGLNYRTVKHHVELLLDYGLIESTGQGYGKVYFLSPMLEDNYEMLEDIERKLHTVFRSPMIYRKVVENTHEGIMILNEDKDIIFVNKSAQDITGYHSEELRGCNVERVITDIITDHEDVLKEEEFIEERIEIETKNGEKLTLDIIIDHIDFDGKEKKGFSLLIKDITKETKQKKVLDMLMEHSDVMMAYLDIDFNVVYANTAFAKKSDHPLTDMIGKNHFDLFPNSNNKKIFMDVIKEGEKKVINNSPLFDEDDEEHLLWTLNPVKDGKDEIDGLILSVYDARAD